MGEYKIKSHESISLNKYMWRKKSLFSNLVYNSFSSSFCAPAFDLFDFRFDEHGTRKINRVQLYLCAVLQSAHNTTVELEMVYVRLLLLL